MVHRASEEWRVEIDQLIAAARKVREAAYAPYSKFKVGAALQAEDQRIFVGCNVENLSFGLTMCAERVAVGRAIADGARSFSRLVVVADTDRPVSPCGACRQVLAEFGPDLVIHLCTLTGVQEEFRLTDLLPRATTGILNR